MLPPNADYLKDMKNLFINRKKLIFAIGTVIMVVFIVAGLVLPDIDTPPTPTPHDDIRRDTSGGNVIIPTGEKITASGKIVENFFKKGSINPRGDVLISNTKDYQINYFSKEDQFLISIIGRPFETARKPAEREFLTALNIDEETACDMNVIITTPNFANPNEAGKSYPLSFCGKE
jgi:hypothetical protein